MSVTSLSWKSLPAVSTISNWLENFLITYKKLLPDPAERNSPSVIIERHDYAKWCLERSAKAKQRLIFIDKHGHNL